MVLVIIFVTCYMYCKCTCNHIQDYKCDYKYHLNHYCTVNHINICIWGGNAHGRNCDLTANHTAISISGIPTWVTQVHHGLPPWGTNAHVTLVTTVYNKLSVRHLLLQNTQTHIFISTTMEVRFNSSNLSKC